MKERKLPSDDNAERTILGAILVDQETFGSARLQLAADDFYRESHRYIFKAMSSLWNQSRAIDLVTLRAELAGETQLEASGGVAYLASLVDGVPRIANLDEWAEIVREKARLRRIIAQAQRAAQAAYDEAESSEIIATLREQALNIGGRVEATGNGRVWLWSQLGAALRELDEFQTGSTTGRVPTGITQIDRRLLGGFRAGEVILVGAITGGGKTTLLQGLCANAATGGRRVLFVSPEMTPENLAEREIVRRSGVSRWERAPWTRSRENTGMAEARRDRALNAHIAAFNRLQDERPAVALLDLVDTGMTEVEEAATAMSREAGGLAMVAIDYAQQIADVDPDKPRYLSVGEVATRSVALARTLQIPVVVSSQVNVTETRARGAAAPVLRYSFRETAILEQKAAVALIFEARRQPETEEGEEQDIEARIFATKVRNGPVFSVPVFYDPATFTVANLARNTNEQAGPSQGRRWWEDAD